MQSSLQVAWLAIKPGPPPLNAVLRAQLAIKSDLVLALAVNIFNLIPGSIVLEIDQAPPALYVHVLDVGNEKAVARFYRQVEQTSGCWWQRSSATPTGSLVRQPQEESP